MAKQPTLQNITSGYASNTLLNNNFDKIETAFLNTLSRDGSTPNNMEADLDMDGNDILNANKVYVETLLIGGEEVVIGGLIRPEDARMGSYNVKDFGAAGDGVTDDTLAIQKTIDYVVTIGGGEVYIPAGVYMVSTLTLKSKVYIFGSGYGVTKLKQIAGTNATMLITEGAASEQDIKDGCLVNLTVDGNYFLDYSTSNQWNTVNPTLGNTSGNGIVLHAKGFEIDIVLGNIAGVGLYVRNWQSEPAEPAQMNNIRIQGRVFGKEAMIIQKSNDWIIDKAFVGNCGLVPVYDDTYVGTKPLGDARTDVATTGWVQLAGEADTPEHNGAGGIILDRTNNEINDIHVFACWSGTGFRTLNTVRLTRGGRIISESNRAQVNISEGTYGSAMFDCRRLGLYHPNWTGALYDNSVILGQTGTSNPEFDAVTIKSQKGFDCDVTVRRTITGSSPRAKDVTGLVLDGSSINVRYTYSNSTVPSDDPWAGIEEGFPYVGSALNIYEGAHCNNVTAHISQCNGRAIFVRGDTNVITFTADSCIGSWTLFRETVNNGLRGNTFHGSIHDCEYGFYSEGEPYSEILNIAGDMKNELVFTGGTITVPKSNVFDGLAPSIQKGSIWNVSFLYNDASAVDPQDSLTSMSTRLRGSVALDLNAPTGVKEATIDFEGGRRNQFLYTPRVEELTHSIQATLGPSETNAAVQFLAIKDWTETSVTLFYELAQAKNDPATSITATVKVG